MSDITKCAYGCSKQLLCKRWTVPDHQFRQSVADFKPEIASGTCFNFWPNAVAEAEIDHLVNHNED